MSKIPVLHLITELNIGGWKLYDEQDDNVFVIPNGATLAADTRLVLSADPEAFAIAYPDVTNVIGGFGFRLANGGDAVRLVDSAGAIVESITYDDKAPWPTAPDGNGHTLTRAIPLAAPGTPASWAT